MDADAATSAGWAQVSASGAGVAGVVAYAIFTQRVPGRQDQDGTAQPEHRNDRGFSPRACHVELRHAALAGRGGKLVRQDKGGVP